jgi:hypothetical protein
MRWTHSDRVDFADIGRYHTDLYCGSLDRLVDLTEGGAFDDVPVHHTYYSAFMADPIATVGAVADAIGTPLDATTTTRMREYLDAHPQGQHGEHRYSFDDLGVDRADARKRFARYQEYFSVESEV